ncbi:HAMP domain-containing sensor histidine kinase [Bacteriovoracaceae bacterium]|nr:HAMP domain-containing sensor histidine kinase [Bacteriovoracaceae bacterium]
MLNSLKDSMIKFLDWFIPTEMREGFSYSELHKARMICTSGFFGIFVPWILLALAPHYPQRFRYIFYGLWTLAFFALFSFKLFNCTLKMSGIVCTLGLTVILSIFILNHEITFSGTTNWLSTAVLMGVFLVGLRWGFFLSFLMICALSASHYMFAKNGVVLPSFWTVEQWQANMHGDQIMALIFNTVIVAFFLLTKERSDKELLESQEYIRKQQETIFKKSRMAELGKVSGGIAHEINNPMTIILANAQRIKKEIQQKNPDLEKIQKISEKIEKTGKRVGKIIDGLKHFSRDGATDDFQEIDFCVLLDEVKEMFYEKMHQSEISLSIEIENTESKVFGRFTQIYQILVNIIDNACDALENESDKSIKIICKSEDQYFNVIIRDSGPGIAEDIEEKVFQPFFTTKPVGKGTGLGLSICIGIMNEHGGCLKIDRSFNDSRLVLKFPLTKA